MELTDLKATAAREINVLRLDIQDLKRCQLQYFALTITGTGVLLGLSAILGDDLKGVALLSPLAIILPCWLIFFDKATTVTRIVGYQRILEEQLGESVPICRYFGYENALAHFRAYEYEAWRAVRDKMEDGDPNLVGMLLLRTRHRFWMINWYTFALLSGICCTGAYTVLSGNMVSLFLPFGIHLSAPERIMWAGTAFILVGICLAHTALQIISLTWGRSSYNGCALIWKHILHPNFPKNRVEAQP